MVGLIQPPDVGKLGAKIRDSYQAAGLNRHSFARKIGASYSTVTRWEAGDAEPRHAYLQKIADVCNIPVGSLMDEESPVEESQMAEEFREWLSMDAPDDLTDDERDTLASIRFRGPHPGSGWYTFALGTWRAATHSKTRIRRITR